MYLWPFKPQRDYAETLSWRTDVLRAKSAEQRIATRVAPRVTLPHEFVMDAQQFSRAQSMARSLSAGQLLVPLWSYVSVIGPVSAGVSVLPVDTRYADYREGGQLMLWQSDTQYEVATIGATTTASITLAEPTTQSYTAARIAPVVTAHFAEPFSATRRGGHYVRTQAAFISTDMVDLSAAVTYPLYRDAPVMTDCIKLMGGINERFEREHFAVDNETGLISLEAEYSYSVKATMMNWRPWSRPDLYALRQWLHYCRGRQRGFWLPSYNNDLQLISDIAASDTTLNVAAVGYPDFETMRDAMIEDTAGTRTYLRVTGGAEGLGSTEVLTLEAAAGVDLAVAQVRRISYLTYMRNNADRVEIQHYSPGRATVSVPVMEAPAP